jgi:hypothetical protein
MHLVWSAYDNLHHVGKHDVLGTTYPEANADDGASPQRSWGFLSGKPQLAFSHVRNRSPSNGDSRTSFN